jgi:hypothetical protein
MKNNSQISNDRFVVNVNGKVTDKYKILREVCMWVIYSLEEEFLGLSTWLLLNLNSNIIKLLKEWKKKEVSN